MNETLQIGSINRLAIERDTPHGFFLRSENGEEILLPRAYVTEEMQIGDTIDVFVYTDSEDRPVATTQRPKAMLGEFALFNVVDTTRFGAFVDWGLPKDLFVPISLQKKPFKVGEKHFLRVIADEQTGRLVGTEKITSYLKKAPRSLHPNDAVELLLLARTPLGYKVIVNNAYEGLIYHNEIFEKVETGQQRTGYVKTLRQDGKLDITLRPMGQAKDDDAAQNVLAQLDAHNGMLPYNYKSDADQIKQVFGLSKKSYKRALTQLQESGSIEVKENGIYRIGR